MLRLSNLSKTYPVAPWWLRPLLRTAASEPVEALRAVDLEIPPGTIVGLVGPNGAGKTTLIKSVCGLLEPTSGQVCIDGSDLRHDPAAAKARLGLVLADDRGLYWRLTGAQNLELFGVLAGLTPSAARQRADELLAELDLARRDRLVFGYSSGMRARLSIARALMVDPPLLVLDEPTRSMDPLASAELNAMLRRLADDGKAILLASHRLDEVAAICDQVVVLFEGTVQHAGPVSPGDATSAHIARLLEMPR